MSVLEPPASRNAPCPCGSGKRYKDCHGALGGPPAYVAPDPAPFLHDAFDALDRNDLAAAEAAARAVHAIEPTHPQAWDVLASCALLRDDFAGALACCDHAIAARPDYAPYHVTRGRALSAVDERGQAEDAWRRALALDPTDPEAMFCLGNSARERGAHDEATRIFEAALLSDPHDPLMLNGLGLALGLAGDDAGARNAYEHALSHADCPAEVHANLARLLHRRQDYAAAAIHYDAFITRTADASADLFWALGLCRRKLGELPAAEQSYREALRRAPDHADVKHELATVLVELGQGAEAVELLSQLVDSASHIPYLRATLASARQMVCDWTDWESNFAALRARIATVDATTDEATEATIVPLGSLAMPLSPAEQLIVARRFAATIPRMTTAGPIITRTDTAGRRLRIGYVSSDFRAHPIPYLLTELWERHNRARFEVHAYSLGRSDGSSLRRRIERAFEHFADVSSETAEGTLARIRADGIDVLIDLNGYTAGSRAEIFAARAAPLQMHWLGFLGTQGAEWFDYIVTDRFVTPPEAAPSFAERFLYVPGGYTPSDTRRPIDATVPSRASLGLPHDGFVFCCFNSGYKIIPPMFDAWMRILAAIDRSVLWLAPADAATCANLRREAAARGVATHRLVFATRAELPAYLARLKLADLFLDTWPYNAGTTANDALFVGLPLLTLAGETMASRVAASQLATAGLPGLVTRDLAEYEARAIELARSPDKLATLRQKVVDARTASSLFDMASYTRGFEGALEAAWEEHFRAQR